MYGTEEERKKANTEARTRASAKYHSKVYDSTMLRVAKGTFDRIRATGAESINGYAARAVYEALQRDEKSLEPRAASATITIEIQPADYDALKRYGTPESIAAAAVHAVIEECKAGIYSPPESL